MKQTIHYVDAPIGSGKSYSLKTYLTDTQRQAVIATQLNALSDEYHNDLTARGVTSICIQSDEDKGIIARKKFSDHIYSKTQVLEVNQQVALKQFDQPIERDLFIDEVPSIFSYYDLYDIDTVLDFFAGCMEKRKTASSEFYELVPTPAMMDIAQNGHRSSSLSQTVFKKVCDFVADPHYSVEVEAETFDRFKAGEISYLRFFVLLKPSIIAQYPTTTIMGANFKDSILYKVWRNEVVFVEHPELPAMLRYRDLSHKAHLTDVRFISVKECSKALLMRLGYENVCTAVAAAIDVEFPNKDYIFCVNNSEDGVPYAWSTDNKTATRVSPDSRGVNTFSHINMAVQLAALNYDNTTVRYFERRHGITHEELKRAMTLERYSQFFGRTALRDPASQERITLIAFDLQSALFMSDMVGCEFPSFLDTGIHVLGEAPKKRGPKKTVHRTVEEERAYQREKKARQRARVKAAA